MAKEKDNDTSPDEPIASTLGKKIQINDFAESDDATVSYTDEVEKSEEVDIEEEKTETIDEPSPDISEIDNDNIDIKQEDEVIADDVLLDDEVDASKEKEVAGNGNNLDAENVDNDASKTEKTITEKTITEKTITEKTIGDAIDEIENESNIFESDPEIDAVVDEIVRTESDEIIAETDAKLEALQAKKEKRNFIQKIGGGFRAWWNNRPVRYGVLTGVVVLLAIVAVLPVARYAVLNILGIRVSSSMTIVDSQTRLPLKNIDIQLQDKFAVTNEEGKVTFSELKLGKSQLAITKRGYADGRRDIVLGWGSNPLGEQLLIATGEQFVFLLSDWKSDKPITNAEATTGENSAVADDSGKIILTIGEEDLASIEISIIAEGYRVEKFMSESLTGDETKVAMIPSKKHAFVSNRNGEYDLYVIDFDGKNEKILLASTGKEREVPVVIPHPTKDVIAFVSSRSGEENKDGFVMDGLYIVDTISASEERITRSEQLQVIGWSGDKIIYLQVVEGTSQGNDERSKLVSYNFVTKEKVDLATANYFNDVELIGSKVYYGISSFAVPESLAKLYMVDADGQNKAKVIDMQVWNIFRTSYDTLLFSAVNQEWFRKIGDNPIEKISHQPAPIVKSFVNSPDGKRTVWIEIRDGKGVLLKSATNEIKEEQVLGLPGLNEVLYWADNSTVIFRVISNSETADYVLNLDGGEMQKIVDVTVTINNYF